MSRLLELYELYHKELKDILDEFDNEEDYFYGAMKEFVILYEKKKYLCKKLEAIEREMALEVSDGFNNG